MSAAGDVRLPRRADAVDPDWEGDVPLASSEGDIPDGGVRIAPCNLSAKYMCPSSSESSPSSSSSLNPTGDGARVCSPPDVDGRDCSVSNTFGGAFADARSEEAPPTNANGFVWEIDEERDMRPPSTDTEEGGGSAPDIEGGADGGGRTGVMVGCVGDW